MDGNKKMKKADLFKEIENDLRDFHTCMNAVGQDSNAVCNKRKKDVLRKINRVINNE